MKNFLIVVYVVFGFYSSSFYGQTYCSTPITQNTTANINLAATPPAASKYYTTLNLASTNATITAGSRYYAGTGVKLLPPFKAISSTTTKFVAAVGPCATTATKEQEENEIIKDTGNIVLYPNPASNSFTSTFTNVSVSSLFIYSVEGRQVFSRSNLENEKEIEVEVAPLPEGVYTVLYLTTEGERIVKKIVKSRQ